MFFITSSLKYQKIGSWGWMMKITSLDTEDLNSIRKSIKTIILQASKSVIKKKCIFEKKQPRIRENPYWGRAMQAS